MYKLLKNVYFLGLSIKDLLFFWTGWELLPRPGALLKVKVDLGKSQELLPESRTCFNELVMPSYESFVLLKTKMDKALAFGAKGFSFL